MMKICQNPVPIAATTRLVIRYKTICDDIFWSQGDMNLLFLVCSASASTSRAALKGKSDWLI